MFYKVNRPLYGMRESPMHWFNTYPSYHKEKLGMSATPLDNWLLYSKNNDGFSGIIGLQVDDKLIGGTEDFLSIEYKVSNTFPNLGRSEITETPERFNGLDISKISVEYRESQDKYISEIPEVDLSKINFVEFRSLRAKYAYFAYSTMPQILVHVALLSQVTAAIFAADRTTVIKLLKKLVHLGWILIQNPCFRCYITLAQTTEKRLLIDLNLSREAYEKRDINGILNTI